MTLAIANQKGGACKTAATFNLAHILVRSRETYVLVIDNDPKGNLTQ
jgi:cellulose biosynthesis protein BcsQ